MPPKRPEEAESTSGMSTYYLCSCVIFSFLSVYCVIYFFQYNGTTCLVNDVSPLGLAMKNKAEAEAKKEADNAAASGSVAPPPKDPTAKKNSRGLNIVDYSRNLEKISLFDDDLFLKSD